MHKLNYQISALGVGLWMFTVGIAQMFCIAAITCPELLAQRIPAMPTLQSPSAYQASQSTTQASGSPQELILQQVAELRAEVRALREELGEMHRMLEELRRSSVRRSGLAAPAKVVLGDDPTLGDPAAPIVIVEFSDYECPYCRRFRVQTFPKLKEDYIDTGKVRFVFRDYPLRQIHPRALGAAIAASCAGKQGAHAAMQQALFDNQKRLGPELYLGLAQTLSLDIPAFQSCLSDPAELQEIEGDLREGQVLGVRGTPYYLIGRAAGKEVVDLRPVNGA